MLQRVYALAAERGKRHLNIVLTISFVPQRFDGIEQGSFPSGIKTRWCGQRPHPNMHSDVGSSYQLVPGDLTGLRGHFRAQVLGKFFYAFQLLVKLFRQLTLIDSLDPLRNPCR